MTKEEKLIKLKALAKLMDSQFQGPLGFKYGLDALLGLIPGLGDILTSGVSLYIIIQSALLGCNSTILFRMGLNVFVENIFDMIPILGNVFDFVWRSNNKNIALLELHLLKPAEATFQSRLVLGFVSFSILLLLVSGFAFSVFLFQKIISLFY